MFKKHIQYCILKKKKSCIDFRYTCVKDAVYIVLCITMYPFGSGFCHSLNDVWVIAPWSHGIIDWKPL